MREALTRRCARIVAGEYPAPDLLVIDGGKGQVAVAADVLAEQGLHGVPLIGIAKGPERKAGEEDIVFPDRDDGAEPAARSSGTAPAAADPRRGASVRDPGPSRAARQGAHHVDAAGDRRHRRDEAPGAARALRRRARACRRRAWRTSRACPGFRGRWPSGSSPSCTDSPNFASVESQAPRVSRAHADALQHSHRVDLAADRHDPGLRRRLLPAGHVADAGRQELDGDVDLRGRRRSPTGSTVISRGGGRRPARSARSSIRSPTS